MGGGAITSERLERVARGSRSCSNCVCNCICVFFIFVYFSFSCICICVFVYLYLSGWRSYYHGEVRESGEGK